MTECRPPGVGRKKETDSTSEARGTTIELHERLEPGESGADILTAGAGNDFVYGDNGNDSLAGQAGDDHLYGGVGEDTLVADTDNDWLYGGFRNNALRRNKRGRESFLDTAAPSAEKRPSPAVPVSPPVTWPTMR